jgi:metal-sulfur cluster biosynthetic enzyme
VSAPLPPAGVADGSDRRGEVLQALDAIHDPCSVSIGKPIGLVGMGIIDAVAIDGGAVTVTVLPTFPDCLFRGVFEAEIEARLSALPWCRSVSVAFAPADRGWDESRMSPDALRRLGRKSKQKSRVTTTRAGQMES